VIEMLRASIIACSLFLSSQAFALNIAGDYSGPCSGNNQCAVEINDKAQVSIIVADRLDYSKRKCAISGTLQHSAKGLAGEIQKGWKVSLVKTPTSGVYLNGLPKEACGLNLNGYYEVIGD